ncbi:hypothetical protein CEXT_94451 [Caerostris extrusa]|uniref:Uncharacterized protein n=1 Tax=Caerostris extrusa TaxID=172846 RepID=A0AAV4XYW6_CAEEX|nr:hypothetical protein CEXT_94451 [Caerostris extrusa]
MSGISDDIKQSVVAGRDTCRIASVCFQAIHPCVDAKPVPTIEDSPPKGRFVRYFMVPFYKLDVRLFWVLRNIAFYSRIRDRVIVGVLRNGFGVTRFLVLNSFLERLMFIALR